MKILVCISNVPDTTAKISFVDDNTKFNKDGVQYIINPYDEWYALVKGIELVEKNGGEVVVCHVGDSSSDPTIRKALAIGGTSAVRIDINPKDAFETAKYISNYAKDKDFDVIIGGKETIDYNGGLVMGLVAANLDLEYFSQATKLEYSDNTFEITRDASGSKEVYQIEGPLVLSASKGMAEQRIANMRGIMQARSKKLEVISSENIENKTDFSKFSLPPKKDGCKMVDSVDELIDLLKNEAKAID